MMNSYLVYIGTVLFATFFAFLAQRFSENINGKVLPNQLFYWLSMLSLVFLMGLRSINVGVDGLNYYYNYLEANAVNFSTYYQTNVTEPGFYLLYRISYFLGDHLWLFLISAFITVFFFYKALSYELGKISFPLAVFIFSCTQYFYYFGIMRMGIAVAIIAFAYRYILEKNIKKYIFYVLLATMFHYSALFALIVLLLNKNHKEFFKKTNLLKITLLIPISFLIIKFFIFPFITADRYEGYTESSGFLSFGFITTLPLLLFFSFFYNKFTRVNPHFQFYYLLFLAKVITEIFSPIIGIGRVVWYLNLSICFLFPAIINLTRDKKIKIIILGLAITYSIGYGFNAYFGDSWRGENMFPYKLFFEEQFE